MQVRSEAVNVSYKNLHESYKKFHKNIQNFTNKFFEEDDHNDHACHDLRLFSESEELRINNEKQKVKRKKETIKNELNSVFNNIHHLNFLATQIKECNSRSEIKKIILDTPLFKERLAKFLTEHDEKSLANLATWQNYFTGIVIELRNSTLENSLAHLNEEPDLLPLHTTDIVKAYFLRMLAADIIEVAQDQLLSTPGKVKKFKSIIIFCEMKSLNKYDDFSRYDDNSLVISATEFINSTKSYILKLSALHEFIEEKRHKYEKISTVILPKLKSQLSPEAWASLFCLTKSSHVELLLYKICERNFETMEIFCDYLSTLAPQNLNNLIRVLNSKRQEFPLITDFLDSPFSIAAWSIVVAKIEAQIEKINLDILGDNIEIEKLQSQIQNLDPFAFEPNLLKKLPIGLSLLAQQIKNNSIQTKQIEPTEIQVSTNQSTKLFLSEGLITLPLNKEGYSAYVEKLKDEISFEEDSELEFSSLSSSRTEEIALDSVRSFSH